LSKRIVCHQPGGGGRKRNGEGDEDGKPGVNFKTPSTSCVSRPGGTGKKKSTRGAVKGAKRVCELFGTGRGESKWKSWGRKRLPNPQHKEGVGTKNENCESIAGGVTRRKKGGKKGSKKGTLLKKLTQIRQKSQKKKVKEKAGGGR